jgi:hypothetical protein
MTIAFSGDTFFLPNFDEVHGQASSGVPILEQLLAIHLGSGRKIDFLAVTLAQFELFKIADGRMSKIEAGYIGSHPAFEKVQHERHSGEVPSSTIMQMTMLPDAAGDLSRKAYGDDLSAFNRMLETESAEVGGFPVPYFAVAKGGRFGDYTFVTRRPLSPHEVSGNEPRAVSFQGAPEGTFTINFGGTSNAFACHVLEGNLGLEWHPSFGFDVRTEKLLDWRFWKKMKSTYGITATKIHGHPINQIINALMLSRNGNFQQAIEDIEYAIGGILQSCKDAQGKNISWDGQTLREILGSADVMTIPLEEVGYLLHCFRLRRQFFAEANVQRTLAAATDDLQLLEKATRGHLSFSLHKFS